MADILHGKNITRKHQYQRLFSMKWDPACNFIKQRLQHMCIPVNFAKFLKANLLQSICEGLLPKFTLFCLNKKVILHPDNKKRANKSFHKQKETKLINWSVKIRKTQQLKVSLLRVSKVESNYLILQICSQQSFQSDSVVCFMKEKVRELCQL